MKTYLVTGGAGFIGSNYIHYMFDKYGDSIRIINVDKLTYAGNLENLKDIEDRPNYTFVKADICDAEAIGKVFAENDIDRVVHFAAESHVDRSIKNPEVFVQTNVVGTAVMLNSAKAMKQHLLILTAHIHQVRLHQTLSLRLMWILISSRQLSQTAQTTMVHISSQRS